VDAWFELVLLRDVAAAHDGWTDTETESVLCGAARAGLSISRWLLRLHDPTAAPILADLKDRFPSQLSPFWKEAPQGVAELSRIFSQGEA
jgi:hypothetical protein